MKNSIYILAVCSTLMLAVGCKKTNKQSADSVEQSSQTDPLQTGKPTKYPITVTSYDEDGQPTEQQFTEAPQRVIPSNTSSTEMLLDLGLRDKIVGIVRPENKVVGKWAEEIEKLNIMGSKFSISKEILLGQNPDILIGPSRGFSKGSNNSIASYNKMGVKVYTQSASIVQHNRGLEGVIQDIRTLGQIFDVNPRAEEYAKEQEEKLERIKREIAKKNSKEKLTLLTLVNFDPKKKTFSSFPISGGLPLAMLNQLELKPAIETGLQNNNYENLINIDPDIILYITYDRDPNATPTDFFLKDPLLKNVSAIKHKRVFAVGYDDFLDYGARNFDTLVRLYYEIYGGKE